MSAAALQLRSDDGNGAGPGSGPASSCSGWRREHEDICQNDRATDRDHHG